ncbi:DNA-processing protein DprA [Pseudactinotalea sp. HY158]|uniref:DNA-processing protein DprA n=1 Tax=Pseudactinotalea sp. HY158 TaxID=2654547 RepID=UPI00129C267C|nr:DNA-processing protein DprA [Pseudactinotalea sp. HY158]QGH69897.1 DNA-protecting protein DprA [Pseudactinotalea sp. HY158]
MTPLSYDATDPLLARIAWSRIIEPGDRVAGCLLAGIGPVAALDWLATGGADGPPGMPPHAAWARSARNWRPRLRDLDPRREHDAIDRLAGAVLTPEGAGWPAGLTDLGPGAPPCLWVRGVIEAISRPAVSLVGARACTHYGQHVTGRLAGAAADAGLVVTSGGAFGIDAAAHRATLEVGGTTVAYQAGGVDRFYPGAHTPLLESVIERGAVVSEAPPGSAPMRQRFLQRNRLIAAATAAVVVVEAAWRSGALSTAHHAAGLLRPVGAVPGPVTSPASAGCHRLLRDQVATCITDEEELLELAGPIGSVDPRPAEVPAGLLDDLDPETAQVLDALPVRAATGVDALVRVAGLAPAAVIRALGVLELAGKVARHGDGWRRAR